MLHENEISLGYAGSDCLNKCFTKKLFIMKKGFGVLATSYAEAVAEFFTPYGRKIIFEQLKITLSYSALFTLTVLLFMPWVLCAWGISFMIAFASWWRLGLFDVYAYWQFVIVSLMVTSPFLYAMFTRGHLYMNWIQPFVTKIENGPIWIKIFGTKYKFFPPAEEFEEEYA